MKEAQKMISEHLEGMNEEQKMAMVVNGKLNWLSILRTGLKTDLQQSQIKQLQSENKELNKKIK